VAICSSFGKTSAFQLLKERWEKDVVVIPKSPFPRFTPGEDWGMDAWIVLLGNRLAAYSVGAPLSPDTYGIYLEVTDLTVKGIVRLYNSPTSAGRLEPYLYVNTGECGRSATAGGV